MRGQRLDLGPERLDHVLGAAIPTEFGEHHVPGVSLDQRRDERLVTRPDQQIALPVPGHGAILDLRRPLRDRDHVSDPRSTRHLALGFALLAAGPQLSGQLPTQLPAGLDIQRAVDRLVTNPHPSIVGIHALESGRDLLRRPAPRQTPLDRRQQPRIASQLPRLRAPGPHRAPTLSRQRPIPPPLPTSPLDLPTNRRAMPPDRPRDLAIGLPRATPTQIRSRSSNVSRNRECSARRLSINASSRTRAIVSREHPNRAANPPIDAPSTNLSAISPRSSGRNHRYNRPIRPPLTQHENQIVLRRPDESTAAIRTRICIRLPRGVECVVWPVASRGTKPGRTHATDARLRR